MSRTLNILFCLLIAACGPVPNPIYKADVQQGNLLEQESIDELRPGMTKRQVELVLGTPPVSSTFHSNRWDYIYTYRPGRGIMETKRLTVVFEDDRLLRLEGDWKPSDADVVDAESPESEPAAEAGQEPAD